MNCQKSYRRLLNFIISIVILFSGLYFNQTEADAFFDAANPTAQSTVSGVELPISANTQINTSELQQKILCYIHAQDGKKSSYFSV